MPRLLISDANIVIDIECGGLIEYLFRLPYDFAVPDVLFEEELRPAYPSLPEQGLLVLELAPDGVALAADFAVKHARSGCSRNDLLALALAIQEDAPLLTGDAGLRAASIAEGREVHGTLWLVQEIYNAGLITAHDARNAYDAMRAQGSRLPWGEVDKQLKGMR
jgi:hypothetical protein